MIYVITDNQGNIKAACNNYADCKTILAAIYRVKGELWNFQSLIANSLDFSNIK